MYHAIVKRWTIKSVILVSMIFVFGLLGCQQNALTGTPISVSEGELTPYLTITPSMTSNGSNIETPLPATEIPAPTSTPFIYSVVADDTLTGIAFRHSVTLEDLIAANPGIDPSFLTIGLTLTIPIEGVMVASLPTPTPIPLVIDPPICYPGADDGLQCMAVIENDQSFPVENVVALISLQSGDADLVTKTALLPLNIIPAGQKSAVSASFEAPFPQDYVPQVSLLTVIPVLGDEQRYLDSDLQIGEIEIVSEGKQANIKGSVTLLPDQTDASLVWVAALAYDKQDNIVGIRKWVANDVLVSGDKIDFKFMVYSLGPQIDQVDILIETRP